MSGLQKNSRIGKLRSALAEYGTAVKMHYVDGPNSDHGLDDKVMYTIDLTNKLSAKVEEKMLVHLSIFFSGVERAYFTKSERLKIIFS